MSVRWCAAFSRVLRVTSKSQTNCKLHALSVTVRLVCSRHTFGTRWLYFRITQHGWRGCMFVCTKYQGYVVSCNHRTSRRPLSKKYAYINVNTGPEIKTTGPSASPGLAGYWWLKKQADHEDCCGVDQAMYTPKACRVPPMRPTTPLCCSPSLQSVPKGPLLCPMVDPSCCTFHRC